MKVVSLSALYKSRLYPLVNVPATRFCSRLTRPQANISAGWMMSIKISGDIIGNRPPDPPACSAVPQPTAPPRAQKCLVRSTNHTVPHYAICLVSRYCFVLRINYPPQHPIPEHSQPLFSPNLRDKSIALTYSNRQH